jgi:hypothetical protein
MIARSALTNLLQATSVANGSVRALIKHGLKGTVYPISHGHAAIEGLVGCGWKGSGGEIVYCLGIEEVVGSKESAGWLADEAKKHCVAVIDINCQGIGSVPERTTLTFGAASIILGTLEQNSPALVAWSGTLTGANDNCLQKSSSDWFDIVSVENRTCTDATAGPRANPRTARC